MESYIHIDYEFQRSKSEVITPTQCEEKVMFFKKFQRSKSEVITPTKKNFKKDRYSKVSTIEI